MIYSRRGRSRWFNLGPVKAIGLANARKLAREIMYQVAQGQDPQAERKAQRGGDTFAELATTYVEQHAQKVNKSWKQPDRLVRRHLLPRWGKLAASDVTKADVKAALAAITSPSVANQTLRAVSAIFSWAIKEQVGGVLTNPCSHVIGTETKSRERVLSQQEVPQFWQAFEASELRGVALKVLLLTGQRPGEICHMRWEHIVDGWWELPGQPVPALGWPGTKNGESHRVWLPKVARELIGQGTVGFVFASKRGGPIRGLDLLMRAICTGLKVEKATPHDLRRTHGTAITRLGFGKDAMNRIQNHKEGGIASVYDRHQYADENKRIMEAVAQHVMTLIEGRTSNVIPAEFKRQK